MDTETLRKWSEQIDRDIARTERKMVWWSVVVSIILISASIIIGLRSN